MTHARAHDDRDDDEGAGTDTDAPPPRPPTLTRPGGTLPPSWGGRSGATGRTPARAAPQRLSAVRNSFNGHTASVLSGRTALSATANTGGPKPNGRRRRFRWRKSPVSTSALNIIDGSVVTNRKPSSAEVATFSRSRNASRNDR